MRILHKVRGLDVKLRQLECIEDIPDQRSQQLAAEVVIGGQCGKGHGKRNPKLPALSKPLTLLLQRLEEVLAALCIPTAELTASRAAEGRRATCLCPIENLCTHFGTGRTAITTACAGAVVPKSLAFRNPLKSMSDLHLGNMFSATPVPCIEMTCIVTSAWISPPLIKSCRRRKAIFGLLAWHAVDWLDGEDLACENVGLSEEFFCWRRVGLVCWDEVWYTRARSTGAHGSSTQQQEAPEGHHCG
mmetsp:Transcript_63642/g.149158  ORF Transcript_63642/g.149158 Transcript_63642/m.149158 type:complete len:245 (+) Transcript_63642:466-1200(+)